VRDFIAAIFIQPFKGIFGGEPLTAAVEPRQRMIRAVKCLGFNGEAFLCCLSFSDADRFIFRFSIFMSVMIIPQI
jgi:hypothetical protein